MDNIKKLFYKGYMGTDYYRIPALIRTSNNVLISAIDRGHKQDFGDISISVRRSLDFGKTWLPMQTVCALPSGDMLSEGYSALNIDVVLLSHPATQRVFLFFDMFPESKANMEPLLIEKGSGYKEISGNKYLILRDYTKAIKNKKYTLEYTVRENGIVYDDRDMPTAYSCPDITEGTLYKNEAPVGSIFLYTGENAAPLSMVSTSHIWMVYSDNDGESWSSPIDLNDQIKPEYLSILVVGPGRGMVLDTGRMIVNIWSDDRKAGVIYSDDNGTNWYLGNLFKEKIYNFSEAQCVEVTRDDGRHALKMFCRAMPNIIIATSYDGGESFTEYSIDSELLNPSCQISVINYTKTVKGLEGKQVILFAGCDSSASRINGTVKLGYYEDATDSFVWLASKMISEFAYMYSCLEILDGDEIGLIYEISSQDICYVKFSINEFSF